MATRNPGSSCRLLLLIGLSVLLVVVVGRGRAAAQSAVTITSPVSGATVSGTVPVSVTVTSSVVWVNFYVDGNYLASSPPYTYNWNSTTVPNGSHFLSVTAYASGKVLLGTAFVAVNVANGSSTSKLTSTATPTPTPTPAVAITSPANGATVSGTISIVTSYSGSVSWINLYIDGNYLASSPPYTFTWDSTTVANGSHTIRADGKNSSGVVASVSISVNVANSTPTPTTTSTATATPASTATPTPTPASTPTATSTPTPTPTAVVTITSPVNGATVSGTVSIVVTTVNPPVSWVNLYVDRQYIASSPPYTFSWDTTKVANGSHTIAVYGKNSTGVVGSASITVKVANGAATPTPTPTPTTKATATPTPTTKATATPTPTATASATPTATPKPTATPTPGPTTSPTASPTPSPSPTPAGAFYVSPTGNDSNAGTSASPWRTIQKAANTLTAGQTAIVLAGTYNENVSITHSGSSTGTITLQAQAGAKTYSFAISGSYWVVDGFDISNQANNHGIYVKGYASHIQLSNNYVHELCTHGIYMDSGVSYIAVLSNRVWHAEMAGISVDGSYDDLERNEIWDTRQHPVKLGGIYSGCVDPSGADADFFRFFGQHHIFKSNYLHDIPDGTVDNVDPHIDCFQTWGPASDIEFDSNWCRESVDYSTYQTHAGMIEAKSSTTGVSDLRFSNNVFANLQQGLNVNNSLGLAPSAIKTWNNTFDHVYMEALIFSGTDSPTNELVNNIFYDVGHGGDSYCSGCSTAVLSANDFIMRSGSTGTSPSNYPHLSYIPGFVNYGDSTGAGADYHLTSSSAIKDQGLTLSAVPDDYDGTRRPIGSAYSIGGFEE